jgi:hypothetical protein
MKPNSKFLRLKAQISLFLAFSLYTLAFLSTPSAFAAISTNKFFVLETNNVIPPDETNFFAVNSNLLNASVSGGGGGGGGVSSVNGLTGAVTGVLTNGETSAVTLSALTLNSNLSGPGWSIVTNGPATATFASYGPNGGYGLYGSAGWTNYALYPSIITLTGNGLTGNMTASGNITAAQFVGGGGGLTGLNASQLTGYVPNASFASGLKLTNMTIYSGLTLGGSVGAGYGRIAALDFFTLNQLESANGLIFDNTNGLQSPTYGFTGPGSGLTSLNASQLTGGTVPIGVMPQGTATYVLTGNGASAPSYQPSAAGNYGTTNAVAWFNDTLVYSGGSGLANTNIIINAHALNTNINTIVVANLTVTNNVWFAAPINLPTNAAYAFSTNSTQITVNIIESATGGFTFGFDTNYWKFVGGVNLANGITTNANAYSVLTVQNDARGTNNVLAVLSPYFH